MALQALLVLASMATLALAIPSGFSISTRAAGFDGGSGANFPTKIRFLPDGRVMYSIQAGTFYISPNTTPLAKTVLFTVKNVNSDGELGFAQLSLPLFFYFLLSALRHSHCLPIRLLSFVLDPSFTSNGLLHHSPPLISRLLLCVFCRLQLHACVPLHVHGVQHCQQRSQPLCRPRRFARKNLPFWR